MSAERATTPVEHEVKPKHYRLRRSLGWLALTTTILETAYYLPIDIEKYKLSQTHASIVEVAQSDDSSSDLTTYVFGGFGVVNAVPIAEALPQLSQIGNVDAVIYDQGGIDSVAIGEEVIENAKEHHQKAVAFDGSSMGGIPALEVADFVIEHSNLKVEDIILDCTPVDEPVLRPNTKSIIESAARLSGHLPEVEFHPAFQAAYVDVELGHNPITLASGINGAAVIDKINDPETPSTSLLWSEASYILDARFGDDLKRLSHDTVRQGKKQPLLIWERPLQPTGDQVVNSLQDSLQFDKLAENAGLQYNTVLLNGTSHSDPTNPTNRPIYQAALEQTIIPELEASLHPTPPPQYNGKISLSLK